MRARMRAIAAYLVALLLTAGSAGPGHAQPAICPDRVDCELSGRSSQALVLAANALVGGAAAGVTGVLRGEPFWPAFRGGVMGGVATFAGKRLAVEDFDGAGFVGRQVAAVGSSMSYNAAAGRGLFSELMLPLGPARLYLQTDEDPGVSVRLDLYSSAVLMHTFLDRGTHLEVGSSLSSGTFVFWDQTPGAGARWLAQERAGVVRLNGEAWGRHADRHAEIHAHERVHVLQYDQGFLLVGAPLQALAADRLPVLRRGMRWVDLGLEGAVWGLANSAIPYDHRPWEREAAALSRAEGVHRAERSWGREMLMGPGGGGR